MRAWLPTAATFRSQMHRSLQKQACQAFGAPGFSLIINRKSSVPTISFRGQRIGHFVCSTPAEDWAVAAACGHQSIRSGRRRISVTFVVSGARKRLGVAGRRRLVHRFRR